MISFSSASTPCADSEPKRSSSIDRVVLPPRMLKDFLDADLNHSCSSNGFRSFPRKPCRSTTVRNLIDLDLSSTTDSNEFKLQRSRSSRAASNTISAIHRASEIVIGAVKRLRISTVNSPTVLHRSISRRFSNRSFQNESKAKTETVTETVTVKVKDILRWRSFRDLVEEKYPPLDLSSSPNRCTATTESTSTATSSNGSSWCESDFSVDSVGGDYRVEASTGVTVDPKDEQCSKDKEHQTAVSSLDFPFAEHEESLSPLSRSIAHMQRRECILKHKIQKLEKDFQEEEGSKRLPPCHIQTTSSDNYNRRFGPETEEGLLLDFSRREKGNGLEEEEDDSEMVKLAKEGWVNGKQDWSFEWELEDQRHNYIKDMDQEGVVRWCNFKEEQQDFASIMEIAIFINLVDELLFDLLGFFNQ